MRAQAHETRAQTADRADTLVVLDFETSGLSPQHGDRAIELGAVFVEAGQITRRFQSLINPGFRINGFIEAYTGITNELLNRAPPCDEVMDRFAQFLGQHNLVAHNASFDKRFLDAEFAHSKQTYAGQFACSMLIARRLFQDAPDHKLGTLVRYQRITHDGTFHRALADSEMTARLWLKMLEVLALDYAIGTPSFTLMCRLARLPKHAVHDYLKSTDVVGTILATQRRRTGQ
jgi:DNA polymerase-3 subunit epsilon